MIEFFTLFLGLITGPQPVTVAVGPEVATVAFLVDDAPRGEAAGRPWTATVDFGSRLLPRELTAVAQDAHGSELGRARQLINLPRPPAEVSLALENGPDGQPRAVKLAWQSLVRRNPRQIVVTFDGEPLTVDDPRRVALPTTTPGGLHLIHAELTFSKTVVAQASLAFGGTLDEVSSQLSAVPLTLDGKQLPPLETLQQWIVRDREAVPVVAAEKGLADIWFVRSGTAEPELRRQMSKQQTRSVAATNRQGRGAPIGQVTLSDRTRVQLPIGQDQRARVLQAAARPVKQGDVRLRLFPVSPTVSAAEGDLYDAMGQRVVIAKSDGVERLSDAVAVAGLQASAGNRRRAVVLLLAGESQDESLYDPANVRAYLAALRVPLYVWSLTAPTETQRQAWGTVTDVSTVHRMRKAARTLDRALERQRIVWVEGRHLPQRLQLAATVEQARLVGP